MMTKLLCLIFLATSVTTAQSVRTREDHSTTPEDSYYVRSSAQSTYVIEYRGRVYAASCRETLSWLDGIDKPGRPLTDHDCTYMQSLVGQRIPAKFMWHQNDELRYEPWSGLATVQTADILDITAEATIGSPLRVLSPKTSPAILKTLHWMQNTLADEEGKTLYPGKDGNVETRENLLPDLRGCEVTFVYATVTDWKETYRIRQQMDLGTLDPSSIGIDTIGHDIIGPVSDVTAYTTDKAPTVRAEINDRNWQPAMLTPSADLLWVLPAPYATRFAKALRQAVTLCGGKRSSF